MTIQEILEAHQIGYTYADIHGLQKQGCTGCDFRIEGQASEIGNMREIHRAHLAEVLEKHMQEREAQLRQLIRDMTDPGKCWFDHHGGCQEHGYLDLKPGELCPHAEAKQLLGDKSNGR